MKILESDDTVTQRTPAAHWCADCWHWTVDCLHLVDPMTTAHRGIDDDVWIRSLAYDRVHGRLEVAFHWKSVQQFRPVSPVLFRRILNARRAYLEFDRSILRARQIRSVEVRTQRKLLRSMLKGWDLVQMKTSIGD